jgi:purine-binding chemotaxis protein CheW
MEKSFSPEHGSYLAFSIARETYGVELGRVLEIVPATDPHLKPFSYPLVRGVLKRRGREIPVIDLRARFGLEDSMVDGCVVTAVAKGWGGSKVIGFWVDRIQQIVRIAPEDFEATPNLEGDAREDFIKGLALFRDRVVLLLDLDSLAKEESVEEAADEIRYA